MGAQDDYFSPSVFYKEEDVDSVNRNSIYQNEDYSSQTILKKNEETFNCTFDNRPRSNSIVDYFNNDDARRRQSIELINQASSLFELRSVDSNEYNSAQRTSEIDLNQKIQEKHMLIQSQFLDLLN